MTTNNFEDRLLAQLQDVVAARPAPAPAPATRTRRPRLALAAGGVAAAAVAITLVATGGDGGTAKAFTVTPAADGTVSVTIRSLNDAAGLQRSLRAAGVPATVCTHAPEPPPAGAGGVSTGGSGDDGPSLQQRTEPSGGAGGAGLGAQSRVDVRTNADGGSTFTLTKDTIPAGQHLVITAGQSANASSVQVAIGAEARCAT